MDEEFINEDDNQDEIIHEDEQINGRGGKQGKELVFGQSYYWTRQDSDTCLFLDACGHKPHPQIDGLGYKWIGFVIIYL